MQRKHLFSFVAIVSLLSACGGDGGDDGPRAGAMSGSGAGTSGAGTTAGVLAGSGSGSGMSGSSSDAGGTAGTGADPFGDSADNAVMPGTICERLSTIQCAGEVTCCDTARDFAACKSEMLTGCRDTLFLDTVAMNRITGFEAAAAKTAFTTFEAMARACDASVASWGASNTGLRSMLRGTVAAGGDCPISAADATPTAAAALASCLDGANTACMFSAFPGTGIPINWKCNARGDAGTLCFTDANCKEGLYCDNPDLMFNAVCKARKNVGDACEYPNECASLFCKKKLCVAVEQQAAYCLRND
jgi:hypothetical protein